MWGCVGVLCRFALWARTIHAMRTIIHAGRVTFRHLTFYSRAQASPGTHSSCHETLGAADCLMLSFVVVACQAYTPDDGTLGYTPYHYKMDTPVRVKSKSYGRASFKPFTIRCASHPWCC